MKSESTANRTRLIETRRMKRCSRQMADACSSSRVRNEMERRRGKKRLEDKERADAPATRSGCSSSPLPISRAHTFRWCAPTRTGRVLFSPAAVLVCHAPQPRAPSGWRRPRKRAQNRHLKRNNPRERHGKKAATIDP